MKTCANCGAPLNDEAIFCSQCGMACSVNSQPYQEAGQDQVFEQNQQYDGGQQNQQYDAGQQYQQNNYQYQNQYQNQYQYQYQYQNQYQYQYQQPSPYDHTAEFDREDISNNKAYCMLVYLMGVIGIIIALLASGADRSPYINFHVRQAIKFCVIQVLTAIIMAVLAITVIIPIAGAIWLVILLVLRIIAFVQVCMGQAKEPAIIRAFPFLK